MVGSGARDERREFCTVLEALAGDGAGWQGPAGEAFVALMARVLERRAARIGAEVGNAGVMVDPSDVVSEAVMVVDGPPGTTLADNARRILAMERPLGYVVAAVAANTSRAMLSGQMGVGARQVEPGVSPVSHYDGVSEGGSDGFLDRSAARTPWAAGPADAGPAVSPVCRQFAGVLVGRFHARPGAVSRSLEVAADVALAHDSGAGLTRSTSRGRLSLFCAETSSLARAGMDRRQVHAMARLLFGTERHPEWSLLAECARSVRDEDAITVTTWHARHARELRRGRNATRMQAGPKEQPALFNDEFSTRRPGRSLARRSSRTRSGTAAI